MRSTTNELTVSKPENCGIKGQLRLRIRPAHHFSLKYIMDHNPIYSNHDPPATPQPQLIPKQQQNSQRKATKDTTTNNSAAAKMCSYIAHIVQCRQCPARISRQKVQWVRCLARHTPGCHEMERGQDRHFRLCSACQRENRRRSKLCQ